MESLKDFIASQAEKLRNEESQAAHKRSEWVAAVDRLNQQIKAWLTIIEQDGFRMRAFDQVAFEEAFKALLE